MSFYKVSIIVPVYNVEKHIDKTLQSILSQTYSATELILVDDGSTDNSGAICDSYANKYENIVVIHKQNGGLVSAWMAGVASSSSSWIIFVDGDDWIESRHIESLVKEQINSNADIVVVQMKQVGVKEEFLIPFVLPLGNYHGDKKKNELDPVMINANGFEYRGCPFSRCSKLINKNMLLQNLKYEYSGATFEEDFNIIAPVLMDANSISFISPEDGAYCYRYTAGSMLHGYNEKMEDSIKNVYRKLLQACNEKSKYHYIEQIEKEYLSASVRRYTNELRNPNGFVEAHNNICNIKDGALFKKAIRTNVWKKYPFKFRLLVFMISNAGTIYEKMFTRVLIWMRNKNK